MADIMSCDHSLCLKRILNQLNLFYIYICNRLKVMDTKSNEPDYGLQPLSGPKRYT
jgi:hypothetical protein